MMELSGGSVGSFWAAGCSVCAGFMVCRFVGVGLSVWRWGRCAWWGFAGSGLRSQGGSGEEGLSRCALGNKGCSPPMLASTRPRGRPVAGVCWGCAGGGAVVEEGARLLRRFHGVSVCGVSVCGGWVCRSGDGSVCLVGLRGVGPALAGRLWGGRAFALRAGEERVFASNARSDPAPRAPGGWGCAGVGASVEEGDL